MTDTTDTTDAGGQPAFQFTLRPDTEPLQTWVIGDVTISRVVEGISEFPPRFLERLTAERLDACDAWFAPYTNGDRSRLLLSAHSFIVQTPETLVVVDTCVGAHTPQIMQTDPTFGDRLDAALPGGCEAVDAVICTHLHFDHVGWNTRRVDDRLVPTFPNARYLVSTTEYDATLADDHMDVVATSVQPLVDAGRLDPVASDHRVDPWLQLRSSPGHSPGHVCVVISAEANGTPDGLITGDATHSPIQFTWPDISAEVADHDSALATRTREGLVADLLGAPTVVFGTHFPTPTAGQLRAGSDGLVHLAPVEPS